MRGRSVFSPGAVDVVTGNPPQPAEPRHPRYRLEVRRL